MIPFLKVAVVVMGILIVAGVVLLAIMMYGKLSGNSEPERNEITEIIDKDKMPVLSNDLYLQKSLELPKGAEVESIVASGGHLVLLVSVPDQGQKLYFIDIKNVSIKNTLSITNKQ
tara:strand:- start:3300 stop:3647 length:348 start_codon:yes stop_codon:yes gene_type:complete